MLQPSRKQPTTLSILILNIQAFTEIESAMLHVFASGVLCLGFGDFLFLVSFFFCFFVGQTIVCHFYLRKFWPNIFVHFGLRMIFA